MKYLSSVDKKEISGKTCLLRVDFNVPDEELKSGRIPLRIRAILPTIKFLIENSGRIAILSHRGEPALLKQKISKSEFLISKQFSLKSFVKILSRLLKVKIQFVDFLGGGEPDFKTLSSRIKNFKEGSVFLLDNLRFLKGEEEDSDELGKSLASLGDIYVNDAFSVSHRANASVCAITKFLPSFAGLRLEKEIKNLSSVMDNPNHPLIVILGGAKIIDKIGLIENFSDKTDKFLIGGGIANTIFAFDGLPVGDSLYEKDADLSFLNPELRNKLIFPLDVVINKRQILDIGRKTREKYSEIIKEAKTIIWNGPMGFIEDKRFRNGSMAIAEAILRSGARAIIGGGQTTSLIDGKIPENIFLSTGGGAMLEYLAGKKLPGIASLG